MPTVPLHEAAGSRLWSPSGPGAYAFWRLDADDPPTDTQIVTSFHHGYAFHPAYIRAYRAFRRAPTSHAPPVPADFPVFEFTLHRGGRAILRCLKQFRPNSLHRGDDDQHLTLGNNSITRDATGTTTFDLRAADIITGKTFTARLTLAAPRRFPSHALAVLSRALTGARHDWLIDTPASSVTGEIHLPGSPAEAININLQGHGLFQHRAGDGPIDAGIRRLVHGRIAFGDRAFAFHHADPLDRLRLSESVLIETTPDAVSDVSLRSAELSWPTRHKTLPLPYEIRFDTDRGNLRLTGPRVIHETPFSLRLTYGAILNTTTRGHALCELFHPPRLHWPLLSHWIERAIHSAD